jgi:hypothetical protein
VRRRNALGEIREFIYLDEIGVESMLAAVDGEILVQTTKSTSRSREFTAGATKLGDAPLGAAEVATGLRVGRTRAQEETRKSVAQSAFARFRRNNYQSFVLRQTPTYRWLAKRRVNALDPKALRKYGAGVPIKNLRRGDLIELEVTLAAADSYQVRTAINAVADVVYSFPDLLPLEQREAFRQVRPLTALIDNLNGEAIPVVAALPNLQRVDIEGEAWLTVTPGESNDDVEFHAVTMPNWFWGDLGRTLFQSRRYTVLCRIIDPTLRHESASSYVGAILNVIHPQLAATVDNIGPTMMGALRQGTVRGANRQPSAWLIAYADGVAELTKSTRTGPDLSKMPAIDVKQTPMAKQLEFFAAIDHHYGIASGEMAEELSALRHGVRDQFGLWPWSESPQASTPDVSAAVTPRLEVELIAAYW